MRTIGDMEEVKYIPTICTSFNRAVEIGGAPLGRVWMVHGPNAQGKSVLCVLLLESFARLQHTAIYEDAEWTMDKKWLVDHLRLNTAIGYDTPANIEQVIASVDTMISNLEAEKKKRKDPLRKDHLLAVAIDTIKKLVPKAQLKKFLEGAEKGDLKQARSLQAGVLSSWMADIVPKLGATNGTLILVNQERANMNASGPYDRQWDIPCGEALKFDNSMRIRVNYAKAIKIGDTEVGAEHWAYIYKSKVGAAKGAFKFYTSNGLGDCERGFDHAREIVSEIKVRGAPLWSKVEEKDGEYIVSMCGAERVRVKGERELRRLIRDGMIDAYRKALDADIPRYLEAQKIGDADEDGDGEA